MKKENIYNLLIVFGLIVLAVISRFLTHPPNFTPVLAISIFGGAYINNKKMAFMIPLFTMLISDVFLGFHESMVAVYLCMFVGVYIGLYLKKKINPVRLTLSTLTGSILFYLITNFSVWLFSGMYPLTLTGLNQCYIMGLPFYRYTPMEMFGFSLMGDFIYTSILFGAYELFRRFVINPGTVKI